MVGESSIFEYSRNLAHNNPDFSVDAGNFGSDTAESIEDFVTSAHDQLKLNGTI